MDLCLICLRTDRLLKVASNMLEEFHDELCDFSMFTVTLSCYYCSECECLLMKFYEFKQKCVEALKIYQKWKKTRAGNKQPINLLYTLLQAAPLSVLTPNPENTGNFKLQATESQPDTCVEEELVKDTYLREIKIEFDQTCSSDNTDTFADVLKIENVSENIPKSEHVDTDGKAAHSSDNQEDSDNLVDDSEECTNINVIKHDPEDCDEETKISKTKKPIKKTKAIVTEPKKRSRKKNTVTKKPYLDEVKENDKRFESVFDIEYLTTPEMKVEEFQRRKTYESYVKAEHKCEICYQVVKSEKFLEYHTNNWHNETAGTICCPICKVWSSKRSGHNLTHTVVFKCKLCPLITHRRKTIQNHFDWHKGKQYHCEQCNITYKSKSVYRNHMGRVHRLGRNICEGCGRGFYSPLGLSIHKNNSSRCAINKTTTEQKETVEGVRCEECDVTLPSPQVYEAHIFDVHDAPRRHGCPPLTMDGAGLPEYRIQRSRARNTRKPNCLRRKPMKLTCRVCNKVGTSFGWLTLHFKREHPNEDMNILYADKKTHLCDICGTGFSSVYALRDHMTLHTGARPHACDICLKRFRSVNMMRDHRLRHFPSAMPCTLCGKLFKTRSNLNNHIKTHTGERNHKCEICEKAFLTSAALNEHIRGVHDQIRRVKRGAADSGAGRLKREKAMIAEADTDNDFGSYSSD